MLKESMDSYGDRTLTRTRSGGHNETPYYEQTLPAKHLHARSSVRKYRLRWFPREWKRAIKAGTWSRILYAMTGILALSGWIGIAYVIFMIVYRTARLTLVAFPSIFFAKEEERYQLSNDRAEQNIHASSRLNDAVS